MIEIAYEYHTTVLVDEDTNMVHCKGDFDLFQCLANGLGRGPRGLVVLHVDHGAAGKVNA